MRRSLQRSLTSLRSRPFIRAFTRPNSSTPPSTGTLPAGWFEAQNNVLTNAMGPDFSELLVTSSAEGTSAPPVGSVYEINNMAGGFENVYSDIAPTTPGGPDTLSDTLVTPFGNIPITTDLHAFLDPTDSFFPYGPTDPLAVTSAEDTTGFDPTQPFAFFGFEQDASEPTTVTGVSGLTGVAGFLPSFDSVHLNEFFDTAPTGTLPAGLFQADGDVITNAMGGLDELRTPRHQLRGRHQRPAGRIGVRRDQHR